MNIKIGDAYSKIFSISTDDIRNFSDITGDRNPIHLNVDYAKKLLGWSAKKTINDAVKDAWSWEKSIRSVK